MDDIKLYLHLYLNGKSMSKIITILHSMGVHDVYAENPVLLKNEVCVSCSNCHKEIVTTAEAVYRQRKRGRAKYMCKSCAGKKGWTPKKKEVARTKSLEHWGQPNYAGKIVGKALGRQIIKEVETE